MAQSSVSEKEIAEKEERVWADVDEKLKFVNEKGIVMCKYCSKPNAGLKVTSNEISLQDVPYVTTADKDGKVNILFEGTCGHPSQWKPSGPPPCKAVINLMDWKDHTEVHIDDNYALIVASTIPCLNSQEDIIITHSGQIAELSQLDPLCNLRIRLDETSLTVCTEARIQAIYLKGGEEMLNENIKWQVEVFSGKKKKDEEGKEIEESKIYNIEDVKLEKSTLGGLEGKPLSEKKDANTEDIFKLKGNEISFNVPKEWGQKEVRFMASLKEGEADLFAISRKIKVKDHIVAAFFRINPNEVKQGTIQGIEGGEKNYKNLIGPVHHHQGMYKTGNRYFISGSTDKDTPSYTYMIDEKENGNHIHKNSVLFNEGVLKYYRHAGGMQVANGLMAVGIEEYNYGLLGLFGSAVHQRSVVCFFDAANGAELKKLRIIKDDEYKNKIKKLRNEYRDKNKYLTEEELDELVKSDNEYTIVEPSDYASAVGIVYKEDEGKYYVVSRGGRQGVRFYEVSKDRESISTISTTEEPFVGEFQNVNLHQNEWGEIYMFGMGKSQMGGVDTCKIYQVNILQGRAMISSIWINESGEIESTYYRYENEKNKLVFSCTNETSFHWASCIHMENRNLIGNNKGLSTDLIGQSFEQGFQGKFTVYTIDRKTTYYHIREDLALKDYLREGSPGNFYSYKQQEKYRIPLIPQLRCYCFTEDDL